MNACVVRTIHLSRTYSGSGAATEALRDVSFYVERGEMLALRGPSGCGKSTLISLLACADRPTAGRLEIGGNAVEGLPDRALRRIRRRDIGVVFQNFHLLEPLTVRDNVSMPLVLLKRSRAAIYDRVDRILELVGIANLANKYPTELSGGQAQRVAIARAVVHEPTVILADEPTGNLDSHAGKCVVNLLRGIATAGQTIVVATHADSVAAACDRTLWMRDGILTLSKDVFTGCE